MFDTAQPGPADNAALASNLSLTLRMMRVALHVSFAALLGVGIARVLVGGSHAPAVAALVSCGALALGVLYLVGTAVEHRRSLVGRTVSRRSALAWLGVVVVMWAALAWASGDFAWLAFPLFFVVLQVLGLRTGKLSVVLMTLFVGYALSRHSPEPSIALWLGPAFGAAAALVMFWVHQRLYEVSRVQAETIRQLEETRAELASAEHEAGRIAEREQLARDIHDTLAQGFSSIILLSRSARTALDREQASAVSERLEIIADTAAENLSQARDFVTRLQGVGSFDLRADLEFAVAGAGRTATATGLPLAFTCRFSDGPLILPDATGRSLARGVRSLLANVLTHSRATQCVVSVAVFPEQVTIDIYDDGIGFVPSTRLGPFRADGSGFGLHSVRQRVEELGGTMSIESAPGEGTVVTLSVPRVPDLGVSVQADTGTSIGADLPACDEDEGTDV